LAFLSDEWRNFREHRKIAAAQVLAIPLFRGVGDEGNIRGEHSAQPLKWRERSSLHGKMMSMELSNGDLQAVISLVREVCDRWDDPVAWRAHLLVGACRILDGHSAAITGQTLSDDGRFGEPVALAVVGLPEDIRKATYDRVIDTTRNEPVADVSSIVPGYQTLFNQFRAQGWATAARSEIVSDAEHYASTFHHYRSIADCDDYVSSVRVVDEPNRIEVIMVDRQIGAPRFTSREVAILKLLHDEISMLIGVRLATEEHLCLDGLSKRLRETLSLLLEGSSEKQIASALNLSASTVHEYIGRLYRHFRVCTRAELMAYFHKREPALKADAIWAAEK
jgi:DNA-binding CsgD family transcriptional regulator